MKNTDGNTMCGCGVFVLAFCLGIGGCELLMSKARMIDRQVPVVEKVEGNVIYRNDDGEWVGLPPGHTGPKEKD